MLTTEEFRVWCQRLQLLQSTWGETTRHDFIQDKDCPNLSSRLLYLVQEFMSTNDAWSCALHPFNEHSRHIS